MKRALVAALAFALAGAVALALATAAALAPVPTSLPPDPREPGSGGRGAVGGGVSFTDRHGAPLSETFATRWNLGHQVPLHEMPELLVAAFLEAEDQRFFRHRGVDWWARLHALTENLRSRRVVRGASTITEQAVRLITPRPRTLWARWVEGVEARRLERRFGKGEILEFYLNQVPYSRRRRGVAQAALDYFDRDLGTLHPQETLALAVLVRSPSRFDLKRSTEAARRRVDDLARRLEAKGKLASGAAARIRDGRLKLRAAGPVVEAPHFISHLKSLDEAELPGGPPIATLLDGPLQGRVTAMLESQIARLADRNVNDGAAIVIDHLTSEVRAWANAGGFSVDIPGSQIDAVVTARQPGSALKPFLYALALERGWTAATVLDDSPLARPVGQGLHQFRNYSRTHYGPVSLRQAMGNSLNVPAIRAAGELSPAGFLDFLHRLGLASLDRHPALYGEGLALGNGEVTLLELANAYATLARGGEHRAVRLLRDQPAGAPERVLDREVSSIVADILADPDARRLEFGRDSVLSLPVQTAVKTGTSNGYVDAWAFGFSDRFTVGVWLGNLDRGEMDGVSGAIGPAYVLRSIFADLRRIHGERPLPMSPRLRRVEICRDSAQLAAPDCPKLQELFRPEHAPRTACWLHSRVEVPVDARRAASDGGPVRLSQPTPGLLLAMDPRIPDELEAFPFRVDATRVEAVEWLVDGEVVARGGRDELEYLWRLAPGRHTAQARVRRGGGPVVETAAVAFEVR